MGLTQEQRVFFLGAGSIGEAMIKGMVSARLLPPQQITVCNRKQPARLQELLTRYGVRVCEDKREEIEQADILLVAVKPVDLVSALQEIAPMLSPHQLVVSVVAGASTEMIERCLPMSVPVVRAMPNTSSFVQASATAICRGRWATQAHIDIALELFSAIGVSLVVDEELMNAVTGLSGTGPAYFYYVVEALLEAGQACGLSAETSRTLLVQTMYGAAKMLQETDVDPAQLRRNVTSPNGTTMAGMAVLEQGQGHRLFLQAVQRATQRAGEMGQQMQASVEQALSAGSPGGGRQHEGGR